MNNLEKNMAIILKKLRDIHNVTMIKAEFEAEATRLDEAMRLKEIVDCAGLGLVIKIGGAEAIRDMFDAQLLGVSCLVAPMIESAYAMKKYLEAVEIFFPEELKKEVKFGVNIETLQAYHNLREIFNSNGFHRLSFVTVGRVDLALSTGLTRDEINNDIIYETAENICLFAKSKGLKTTLGGGIAVEALPFIKKLAAKNLLDRFETRKIVFQVPKDFKNANEGILLANEFELMWLENKRNYYGSIYREDEKRISMLKKRLIIGKNHKK